MGFRGVVMFSDSLVDDVNYVRDVEVCMLSMIWHNNCFHLNATILILFIIVGVDTDVNIKVFGFAVGMQKLVLFALLSSCKIFRTVVNSNKHYIL
jgi:hypothetical protein